MGADCLFLNELYFLTIGASFFTLHYLQEHVYSMLDFFDEEYAPRLGFELLNLFSVLALKIAIFSAAL